MIKEWLKDNKVKKLSPTKKSKLKSKLEKKEAALNKKREDNTNDFSCSKNGIVVSRYKKKK